MISRLAMVEHQLIPRGINDPRVLKAMRKVPREDFIPEGLRESAYDDGPLPIGEGQTISQPYIVAIMTELAELKPTDRVLEIGTGSGYQAAVLSEIVQEVYTIERFPDLVETARLALKNYSNVHVSIGDGSLGLPEKAPFDAILVTAGAPKPPQSLITQLAPMGRLVIPVGPELMQQMCRITKTESGSLHTEMLEAVRFVPLVGQEGY